MNRRAFVSRVALGAAAACTTVAKPAFAAPSGRLNVRFLGMMAFVERADRSFLVATPGQHGTHHMVHVPFLMARANSPVAKALGMTAVRGVIPAAFDTQLIGSSPSDFAFRNLENTAIEIVSGESDEVINNASQMAQLNRIAPGKRVRGNVEKWASTTVSLRGGRVENSSGHPDAGKVWKFGSYKQTLTDAVNYQNAHGAGAAIRLTSATDARTFNVGAGEAADLWVVSAAVPEARDYNPTRLVHSELLFDYLVDASAVLAECADATGREVPATELPFAKPTSASLGGVATTAMFPPLSELCYIACILLGTTAEK
jgi:hypothetical protein